jgi:chromosome segregation ATPase
MTDDLTEMRGRQDRLEGRVAVLEVTVKEEAGLRAKMDSDLGEMKATLIAHKHSLQALHDTQSDHTKRLTRIENKLGNVENKLGNVEGRVGNVENKLGNVENKLGNVEGKLGNVENKLGNVEGRVENMEQALGDVRIGVHAILDLLDTHLARKSRWAGPTGLLRRDRPRGDISGGN